MTKSLEYQTIVEEKDSESGKTRGGKHAGGEEEDHEALRIQQYARGLQGKIWGKPNLPLKGEKKKRKTVWG